MGVLTAQKSKISALGVVLGYQCNFECAHCLVSSNPQNKVALSARDFDNISRFLVAWQPPKLSFTGGEPLMYYRDSIKQILNSISYSPEVSVVTNASIAKSINFESEMGDLPISNIRISLDRFHLDFGDIDAIAKTAEYFQGKKCSVVIEVTISEPMDMLLVQRLPPELRDLCQFSKVANAGRARATNSFYRFFKFDSSELKGFCPLIEEERVLYLPEKGFTFCCGNLIANETEHSFTKAFGTFDDLCKSDFGRQIQELNFETLSADPELSQDPSHSLKCNMCESYFLRLYGKQEK